MKRIGVLVIGRGYFLPYVQWLAANDGKLFNIVGYVDNEDSIYATAIPGYSNKRNNLTLEELASQCDLVLSLGYWRIIKRDVIDSVPLGILNLHHSYMLRYRGRHTATWAIMNKERSHGTTLHYVSEHLDNGPILGSREVPIMPDDTAHALFDRINVAGLELVKEYLPIALDAERLRNVQLLTPDPVHRTFKKADMNHEVPASKLATDPDGFIRHVRALTFPGMPRPYIVVNGTKLFISAENE